jgi:hypothetical protein
VIAPPNGLLLSTDPRFQDRPRRMELPPLTRQPLSIGYYKSGYPRSTACRPTQPRIDGRSWRNVSVTGKPESSSHRKGTFKIDSPFEKALDTILKAKPDPKLESPPSGPNAQRSEILSSLVRLFLSPLDCKDCFAISPLQRGRKGGHATEHAVKWAHDCAIWQVYYEPHSIRPE